MISSMARNKWTHRLQTPLTHLQSPHNQPTSISPPPHLCSTSLQHSLFISRYPRSTTNIILVTRNWSFLSIYLALSLESTPASLRQPHSSLSLSLTRLVLFPQHRSYLTSERSISTSGGDEVACMMHAHVYFDDTFRQQLRTQHFIVGV